MPTLPSEIMLVLSPFAQVFSERVWDWAQVLVAGAILALMIWRRPALRRRGKVLVAMALLVLAGSVYAARVYFAEVMFTQLPEVVRVPVGGATHLQPEDLLLAVKVGDEAAAYPFPIIGYHHLVNDRLAGPELPDERDDSRPQILVAVLAVAWLRIAEQRGKCAIAQPGLRLRGWRDLLSLRPWCLLLRSGPPGPRTEEEHGNDGRGDG